MIINQGSAIMFILTKYWPGLAGCMTAGHNTSNKRCRAICPSFRMRVYEQRMTQIEAQRKVKVKTGKRSITSFCKN